VGSYKIVAGQPEHTGENDEFIDNDSVNTARTAKPVSVQSAEINNGPFDYKEVDTNGLGCPDDRPVTCLYEANSELASPYYLRVYLDDLMQSLHHYHSVHYGAPGSDELKREDSTGPVDFVNGIIPRSEAGR
jgi:hypothetical protein